MDMKDIPFMSVSEEARRGYVAFSANYRADGSVRRVVIVNERSEVLSQGYFKPGTFVDLHEQKILKGEHSFHWVDQFTDKELLDNPNMFGPLTAEEIGKLREDAAVANLRKTYVHRQRKAS